MDALRTLVRGRDSGMGQTVLVVAVVVVGAWGGWMDEQLHTLVPLLGLFIALFPQHLSTPGAPLANELFLEA